MAQLRDVVLKHGGLHSLLPFCQSMQKGKLFWWRKTVWVLSALCQGEPLPDFSLVRGLFAQLGMREGEEDVV